MLQHCLIASNPSTSQQLVNFDMPRSWVQSIYHRMGYVKRMGTTSRPPLPQGLYDECRVSMEGGPPSMHVHTNNFFYTCFSPGAGDGSSVVIYGELARTYTKKERTAIISFFITLTHIGLIIGMPATTT